jgi:hypothetical protein
MRSKVTSAPAAQPITLTELKSSLRITHSNDDTLLTQYLEDATLFAENYTGKKMITQTITSYYNSMVNNQGINSDDDDWEGVRVGSINQIHSQQTLELEFGPAASITSVDTIDTSNAETTFSSSNYYLDNYDDFQKPRMVINQGESLGNSELREKNSIKIVYVAGYGASGSSVPSALRRAMIILCGELYTNRGDCDIGTCAENCGADKMLDQYMYHNV